ncbi:unnamed protein product, partial [Aphanomyces euteiches]
TARQIHDGTGAFFGLPVEVNGSILTCTVGGFPLSFSVLKSRLGKVSCSSETFKCFQLLRLVVNNDEGTTVFLPTVVDKELYRFLRALSVLPTANVEESVSAETTEADLLGQYLNDHVNLFSPERSIDVMAYFGKQFAVKQQLNVDGWCPRNLSDYIKKEDEGVYGLIQGSIGESGGHLRVVLFGWLANESFEGMLVRERATYVLRFLTTLTANVVCCLASPDIMKRLAPDALMLSKKHSRTFSIQTTKVEEEQARCELESEAVWGDVFDGGVLVPGPEVAVVVVQSDGPVFTEQSNQHLDSADAFGKWLRDVMQTHVVDVQCQIPKPMMASALKLRDKFPKGVLNYISEDAVNECMLAKAEAKVKQDVAMLQKRCEENGAIVFYMRIDGPEQEIVANDALEKDLKMLREWHLSVKSSLQPELDDFRSTIDTCVKNNYVPLERERRFQSPMFVFLSSVSQVSFPYLTKGELVKQALDNSANMLRTCHQNWCRQLKSALKNEEMIAWRVKHEHTAIMQGVNMKNLLTSPKENVVRNCFSAMIENHNKAQPAGHLVTEVVNCTSTNVDFRKQQVKDSGEIVSVYSASTASPELRGRIVLPSKATTASWQCSTRVQVINLQILHVQSPYDRIIIFGVDNYGLTIIDHGGRLQSYFIRSKQVSKVVEKLIVVGNTKLVKVQGGAMLMLLTMNEMDELPDATLKMPLMMEWSRCSVSCLKEILVCFDPKSTRVRMWSLHIATEKVAWQLQKSQTAQSEANRLEAHPMWSFFHLFDMFPVQSLLAKSTESTLRPRRLRLHVSGMAQKATMTNIFAWILHKLHGLNKDLTPLNLEDGLQAHSSGIVSWCGSTMAMTPWVFELVGFVPVQICRASDNQLVVLKNDPEENSLGTEAHKAAQSISFGLISSVLQHWAGPVVVLTSMGEQSTETSSYLNHLTGSTFITSNARCANGVWLNVRVMGKSLLVVLAIGGLGSLESSAQVDSLLCALSGAVSRLTVYQVRNDKDIGALFSKFQQGVSLLRGDSRLFQGKLYLNAKDVTPNDQNDVIHEFQSVLEAIVEDNQATNFVTAMYGGNVEISCCPPLGYVCYDEALGESLEFLKSKDIVPYTNGLDFYNCLTMVLSKINLLDWTCMEDNLKAQQAIKLHSQIRTALRYGKLAHCGLVDGEPEEYIEKWKTLFADTDIMEKLPKDAEMDFELDLNLTTEDLQQEAKIVLLAYFKTFLELVDKPRSPLTEGEFDKLWTFFLWRREHRVRLWVSSLPLVGREEMDDLDACVLKLKQHLRRCSHSCANCKLGCFECFLHGEDFPHDCGTNHKCVNFCAHCASVGEKAMCASVAGHAGPCDCGMKEHTCNVPCSVLTCEKTCRLEVGHEEPHSCGMMLHCCGQPCEALECHGLCTFQFESPHDRHECDAKCCQQTCVMPNCGNVCATFDHFHSVGADHLCGQPHRCMAECKEDGICEVKVTFTRKRRFHSPPRQEISGYKRKCSAVVAADTTLHLGDHRCSSAIHYCDVRCPCCEYFCDKAYGHTDLHRTSHGIMKDTGLISYSQEVDIGEPKNNPAGEQVVAEMCPFFCSKMGRGHVHYKPCQHKASTCVYSALDGRKHCTLQLDRTMPMDEVLHDTYWKTLGWEDPVTSAVEKASFKLCPFTCDASDHSVDAPSYCILDIWHDVVDKSDPRGQQSNHSVVDGHLFICKH